MKNILKRTLAIFLTIVMTIGIAPLSGFVGLKLPEIKISELKLFDFKIHHIDLNEILDVFCMKTEAVTYTSDIYTYNVSNGKVTLTGCIDPAGDVVVPSMLAGYPVTAIGSSAFDSCDAITSVVLPNSVTRIGYGAFYYCTNLISVTISESVTNIDSTAFLECTSLVEFIVNSDNKNYSSDSFGALYNKDKTQLIQYPAGNSRESYIIPDSVTKVTQGAFAGSTRLKSITVPDSITSIDYGMFADCKSLTSIILSDSITSIGSWAFYGCESLISIKIPDNVTSIGDYAFDCCYSLTSITIGSGVKSIGAYAFDGCDNLANFIIDSDNQNYSSDDGVLYNKNKTQLIQYLIGNGRESFIIPDGVEIISANAFRYCDKLTSITISDSVKSIGDWAFFHSTNLKSVVIGDSVVSIGTKAFLDCISLASVTMGKNVKSIGKDAFCGCSSLTSIAFPDSSTSVGTIIGEGAFYKCTSLASITMGNSVAIVGQYAFSGCSNLASVTISDSIKRIESYAFEYCENLSDVYYYGDVESWCGIVFGNNMANPRYYAKNFYMDNELIEEIIIPNTVTEIKKYTFYKFKEIKSVVIPNSVTKIGSNAFEYCNNLSDVYYYGDVESWCGIVFGNSGANPMSYAKNFYMNNELVEEIIVPNTVTEIKNYTFYKFKEIKSVIIPDSVTKIGNYAFYFCEGLTSVMIPDSVTTIGNYAFSYCNGIISFVIPKSVTSIGSGAFSRCAGVSEFVVDSNNPKYSNDNYGVLYNKDKTILIQYPKNNSRQDFKIPDGVTCIGDWAFCDCDNLISITAPGSITSIGDYAIYDNTGLKDVYHNGTSEQWNGSIKGKYEARNVIFHHLLTTVTFTKGSGEDKVTGKVDVSFKQDWFKDDSINYNHNLARLSSQFVMLGYDNASSKTDKPNLRKALETIDMSNIVMAAKEGRDQVNYFIGSRKITVDSKEYDLVFVGLIGSYHEQWYSNFDPGTGPIHQGFLSAKTFVYDALSNYIKKYGFTKDNTKILIAGHSRGAAASNLLAADLIKGELFAKKENIYTYAFATPNSTTLPERTDAKFDRIYNIVNPEDFVTKCIPVSWGYGRYGQTYVLPSKSNEKNSDYKVYKANMQKYFSYFTDGKTYKPYKLAEADTRAVVAALTSTVHNVEQFYNRKLLVGLLPMSTYEFFQRSLCHFVSKVATEEQMDDAYSVIIATAFPSSSDVFQAIIAYFIANGKVFDCFEHAHMAETYCAYMMTMTESQIKEERKGYFNTVNCPVDITVIDNETGEVVGKIVNNVIDEEIASKENSVVMSVDGDSKSFWLPSDGDYEVILTGNDNGTMDYTVSEIDSDIGETERVNFFDVEITEGDSYKGEITADNFAIEEYKITADNGETVSSDENLSDDALQNIEINVSVSGDGYATESMTVTKGDYVSLDALAEENGEFFGWYENGTLISEELTYSFVAKENRNIVAKFSETLNKIYGMVSTRDNENAVVKLKKDSEIIKTVTATDGNYSFAEIPKGEYTLEVSANNYVTYIYNVVMSEDDVVLDVKLSRLGDVNGDGKVNTVDVARANSHAKQVSFLSDYQFACADITGDGKVNTVDVARINAQAKGLVSEVKFNVNDINVINGTSSIKTYKDKDYVAITISPNETETGVYVKMSNGGKVEITDVNGEVQTFDDRYIASLSKNITNPFGTIKVTYPNGASFSYPVVFELYNIEREIDFDPTTKIKPIRGVVSNGSDEKGEYILVEMVEGQTSVGVYKTSLDGTSVTLVGTNGKFTEQEKLYIFYRSQNTFNPEGRLIVADTDGTQKTYRIVFKMY